MKLIVVESPTKARTLAKFLGSEYKIEASMGHVRDLPKSKIGVDVAQNFEPEYEVVKGKQAIITKLKQLAKQSEQVILATDPDREGEAIAWHIQQMLKANTPGVKKSPTPGVTRKFTRITFHEITKEAINEALKHPGEVDLKLVDAQQARRVLDRLVGYNLSPVLWRKVRRGLSAGRVQSVAVRLIVEREAEIAAFKPIEFWEITVEVKKGQENFKVKTNKLKPAESAEICEALKTAQYEVGEIKTRLVHPRPLPPLMTSTMQRTAGNRFGWSAKKTMREAQQLYEQGLITYHRTDSLNLNIEAINQARSLIAKKFGAEYVSEKPNFYKTKAKTSQEAHEAIRPTNVNQETVEVGQGADKLYRLIWERMVMSQMAVGEVEKTTVWVLAKNKDKEYKLSTQGGRVVFPGWMAAGKKLPIDVQLPKLKTGDQLELVAVAPEQKFTLPPARYNEAALIKVLEEKGIGRPSTYAPIISTIQDRNYAEKKEQKLWPTVIGAAVTKFLLKYFATIMDYEFTAGMEQNLDDVEIGKISWQNLLKNFYKDFESKLTQVKEKAERVAIETEKTGEKCPECQEGEVVIRTGRFGKFLSCSKFPECKYTKNYKEILKDFKCPECGSEVVIKKTKRGKQFYGCGNYPKCKWASWNKPKSLQGQSL